MNKKILVLCMSGMIISACTSKKTQGPVEAVHNDSEMYMLVGSYATPEEEGVKVYRFNEETAEATYVSGLKGISNPSYLTPSVDGERIYVVGEDEGDTSTANAILFNKEEGKLTLLNSELTKGERLVTLRLILPGNLCLRQIIWEEALRFLL